MTLWARSCGLFFERLMLLGRVGDQVLKGVHIIDNELMLLTFENALAFQLVKIGGHIGTMHIHNGSHVCEGWELVDEDAAIWLWLAVVGGKGQKEGVDLTLYGFAESANGGRGVQLFTDEEECAVTYLKRRAVGALLSPIETIHRRLDGGDDAYKALKDEFCVQLADSVLAGRGPKTDLTPFWDYVNALSPEQRKEKSLALVGVLTLPFDFTTVDRTALCTLKQLQNNGNRHYYGFFVRKDNQW